MGPQKLLATKYLVPIVSQPLVQRPRLIRLLEAGLKSKVTIVSAPAGFGKSTLLAAWAAPQGAAEASPVRPVGGAALSSPQPQIAWVSLEPSDNTPVVFWQYVFLALKRTLSGRTAKALSALQAPTPGSLESILTAFINASLEDPVWSVLILDDFHVITDEEIHRSLAFLIEHMPPQMHVMLLSRSEPPLPLARLRASRRVNEIGVEELRCTLPETASFLREVMGVHLSDEAIAQMMVRTEGWLVGLQLLGLSMQGRRDPNAVLEEIRGSQRFVFDYLMDEVLRQQPEELQRFLLYTSILERLNVALCNAVLQRDDARTFLERLERANLFVMALDERRQWFRYHQLFREALQTRLEGLERGLVRDLHIRASEWFTAHGDTVSMASHAVQAEAWTEGENLSESERRTQTGYIAAAHAKAEAVRGNAERAREFARLALSQLPKESLLERSTLLSAQSTAALCDGDVKEAQQLMLQAASLMRAAGHPIYALARTAITSIYLHYQGELRAAQTLLKQTLAQVVQPSQSQTTVASLVYVLQTSILLEHNRLEAALKSVSQGICLAEQTRLTAALDLGYTLLSSVRLARGEFREAQVAIEQAMQVSDQQDNLFQQAVGALPIQVRIWLAQGQLGPAQAWASQLGSTPPLESVFARERLDVARVRVLLATRQPSQVLEILHRLIPGAIQTDRWDHVIEMWLLQAVAHDLNADLPAALEVLTRAVRRAEPEGYVRRFLDEGPVMASLLSRLREELATTGPVTYLDQLLNAFKDAAPHPAPVGAVPRQVEFISGPSDFSPLSRRETEVLGFLARGLSNDDIARRMNVSLYTVKSHVRSLLSKLEANNRTHAVVRARALGLLGRTS